MEEGRKDGLLVPRTIENSKDLLAEALKFHGLEDQLGMMHEEIGELLMAVNKWKRNPNQETLDHVAEEWVDVQIILGQVKGYLLEHLPQGSLEYWQDHKLSRLRKRIDKQAERRLQNFKNALGMAGMRQNLFQTLHDKGIIASDGDMDEIADAMRKDEEESLEATFKPKPVEEIEVHEAHVLSSSTD